MSRPRTDSDSTDLLLVSGLVPATILAFLVPGVPWPIEWAFALPFVLVLPGYVVVTALFPTAPAATEGTATGQPEAPGWAVRAAMTLATSAVLVAVLGTLLGIVEMFRLVPLLVSLGAIILLGTWLARVRRRHIATDNPADPTAIVTRSNFPGALGFTGLQTVTVAVAILALVGAVAFVGATPVEDDPYTEAALLEDDGETVLGANGSAALEPATTNTVFLQLENQENTAVTYRFVGQLQRVGPNGTVTERSEVDRGQISLDDSETIRLERTIEPSMTGDNLRLRYLVYTGPIPDEENPENASLAVRQWVTVPSEGSS